MPDLTITVTAEQATRTADALGHEDGGERVPATGQEIQEELKRLLRRKVQVYELQKAQVAANSTVESTLSDEGWND